MHDVNSLKVELAILRIDEASRPAAAHFSKSARS
jgi:hypothetical protein